MNVAICQVGHPGSLDSLTIMLRAIGWRVLVPGDRLRDHLKIAGLDTVMSAARMAEGWGGELATAPHEEATPADMRRRDVIYVDTKAHRNGPRVVAQWPNLAGRVLWFRINGGRPDRIKGDEINPGCPVLTPDLWYGPAAAFHAGGHEHFEGHMSYELHPHGRALFGDRPPDAYTMWPPFARWGLHQQPRNAGDAAWPYDPPLCLVHALRGYGYGDVGDRLRRSIGLRCHGGWESPDGVAAMRGIPGLLARAVAYVHLKSVDAPGYAIYEALASACPVVVPRRFIARTLSHDVLVDGKTCIAVGDGGDDAPLNAGTVTQRWRHVVPDVCAANVEAAVARLRDPAENRRIGEAGCERLRLHLWSPIAASSRVSFEAFMARAFP